LRLVKITKRITDLYYITAKVIDILHRKSNFLPLFRNSSTRFQLQGEN